ncbi:phosphomevalonate kinase [Leuconostoc litchii]|nr:phosphomevalonate kinase [Leuconostoc litchii]
MTKISIPGKLFLAGEYAITHPGNTALIVAITTGLQIEITSATNSSTITSDTISDDLKFNIGQSFSELNHEWRFVCAAIKIFTQYLDMKKLNDNLHEIHISIESDMNHSTGKLGLGSSAAVVVGIISALNKHFEIDLPILKQFKLAALAHLHIQKNGSLGDVAAITYGGVIAYNSPDLSTYILSDKNWIQPELVEITWQNLKITPLLWPASWNILLGATHESADTHKALLSGSLTTDFFHQSDEITKNIIHSVINSDYNNFSNNLKSNQILLSNTLPKNMLHQNCLNYYNHLVRQLEKLVVLDLATMALQL